MDLTIDNLSELEWATLDHLRESLPPSVYAFLKVGTGSTYLAGGYLRSFMLGEEPKDIDIFMEAKELEKIRWFYRPHLLSRGYSCLRTANALTFRKAGCTPIQIITREPVTGGAKGLLESFDFTIAQACVYWEPETASLRSMVTKDFLSDTKSRTLRYTQPKRNEERAGSLLRMLKFLKMGYKADDLTLSQVVARALSSWGVTQALTSRILQDNLISCRNAGQMLQFTPATNGCGSPECDALEDIDTLKITTQGDGGS